MLIKKKYCLLPLKGMVIFPKITTAILVGRKKSIGAVEKAYEDNEKLFAVAQRDESIDNIEQKNLYEVGVLCSIVQKIKLPDGNLKILIQGISKAEVVKFTSSSDYASVEVKIIRDSRLNKNKDEIADLKKIVLNKFDDYLTANKRLPIEIMPSLKNIKTIDELLFYIMTLLPIGSNKKQEILECKDDKEKLEKVFKFLELQIEFLKTENKLSSNIDKKFIGNERDDYKKKIEKYLEDTGFKLTKVRFI